MRHTVCNAIHASSQGSHMKLCLSTRAISHNKNALWNDLETARCAEGWKRQTCCLIHKENSETELCICRKDTWWSRCRLAHMVTRENPREPCITVRLVFTLLPEQFAVRLHLNNGYRSDPLDCFPKEWEQSSNSFYSFLPVFQSWKWSALENWELLIAGAHEKLLTTAT